MTAARASSTNALFGKLQVTTVNAFGQYPMATLATNVSDGVVGKMISPYNRFNDSYRWFSQKGIQIIPIYGKPQFHFLISGMFNGFSANVFINWFDSYL